MPRSQLPAGVLKLASGFLISGTLHLVRPQIFEPIVPKALPAREMVLVSGVAELVCGAGLLHPRTRGITGLPSAALLVAVFPANVQMSISHGQRALRTKQPAHIASFVATLLRLPMQWPMIKTALSSRMPSR